MALITIPANISFTSVEGITLTRNTSVLRSRFTGQRQAVVYPYAIWEFKGKLRDYAPEDAGVIRGFLAALRGQANTFKLPVPGYTKSYSNFVGAISLSAAALVRATTISVSTGSNNHVGILRAGEYFTIQDELKILIADVNTDATGIGVLSFEPPLRKAAAANIVITTVNPYILMYAVDDDVASWSIKPPIIHGFDLDAVEVIDI